MGIIIAINGRNNITEPFMGLSLPSVYKKFKNELCRKKPISRDMPVRAIKGAFIRQDGSCLTETALSF
jgi:hypothetical protein